MTRATRTMMTRMGDLFAVMGAARNAAAAVEAGRRPANNDLKTLGIDPGAFKSIQY